MTHVEAFKTSRRRLLTQIGVSLGIASLTPVLLSQPAAAGGGGGGGGGSNPLNRGNLSTFKYKLFKTAAVMLVGGLLVASGGTAATAIGVAVLLIGAKQLHSRMKKTNTDALDFVFGKTDQMLKN